MTTVGAYEAKTHLSRLLDQVADGETVTITKHGVPVAMLVPPGPAPVALDDVIRELDELADGVDRGGLTLRELIDEGRR